MPIENLHKMIQDILVEVLKEFDIDVKKEYLNVDIIAKKDDKLITIEIENSGDRALENCKKCLFINPTKHIHILINSNPEVLNQFKDKIKILNFKIKNKNKENQNFIELVKKLEEKHIPIREKIKEFKEKTGLSRATYYRYKVRISPA